MNRKMKPAKKHLMLCWHGLTVFQDHPPFTSGMPITLCNHPFAQTKEFKSIKQVIEWVETVKQPWWAKTWRICKFQISLVKYYD